MPVRGPSDGRGPPRSGNSERGIPTRRHEGNGGGAGTDNFWQVAVDSLGDPRAVAARGRRRETGLTFMMPRGPQGPAVSLTCPPCFGYSPPLGKPSGFGFGGDLIE